jgi:hypothetical protein
MSALRDFWTIVVPNLPKLKSPQPGSAADVKDNERQAAAAEEEKKRAEAQVAALKKKAEADAYKAKVTERLAALIGRYKQAVSQNGPAAAEMQSHMAAVKKHVTQRDFEQAAKDLDELELRGDIDEAALLNLSTDDDKRTEAHCFLGMDHAIKGRKGEALAHFRWVKEHGNTSDTEYTIAVAELEQLERPAEGPKR